MPETLPYAWRSRGRDEVAQLARSFNHAADRIERLVEAQRTMLAGASHELRPPLARIRMAIELLPSADRPEIQARLTQDIAELDTLIGELLLASRLDTLEALEHTEDVDVLALLAEEGARIGPRSVANQSVSRATHACCVGSCATSSRTLGATRLARLSRPQCYPSSPTGVRLCIADRGPGVPGSGAGTYLCPLLPSHRHA